MHRKTLTAIGIAILFLGTYIYPAVAVDNVKESSIPLSNGNILFVGGTGEGNYTKIQDAIDNASEGDTVFVYNGTYYERVKIYTSINLTGENRENTIIDAGGKKCPIWIGANYVTISGFTTQNSGNTDYHDAGVHIGRFDYGTLRDCKVIGNKIINNFDGIYALFPEDHYIEGNIIADNRNIGVYLHGSGSDGRVEIINNSIINNSKNGIYIQDPDYNIIAGNTIINNGRCGAQIATYGNTIFKNTIKNHTKGIVIQAGNIIELNSIEENTYGIYIGHGRNKIIKNNFIGNENHAFFEFIFPLGLFSNRWTGNHWEGHKLGPKIIKGNTLIFLFVFDILILLIYFRFYYDVPHWLMILLNFIKPRSIPILNVDWHPASEPYII
jgi:parallel beta-helix repeat protein